MIEYLKTKLHQDVEGTCSGRMGSVLLAPSDARRLLLPSPPITITINPPLCDEQVLCTNQ
jgi:hypothetical protein